MRCIVLLFYPSRRLGISSRVSVYIIAAGVYHHAERVFLRLDDIQGFALMIYRLAADDIHAFGVIEPYSPLCRFCFSASLTFLVFTLVTKKITAQIDTNPMMNIKLKTMMGITPFSIQPLRR